MIRGPLLLLLLACTAAPSHGFAELPDGYETLYLSRHASVEVKTSADALAGLMKRQFGTAPRIRRAPLWGGSGGILIGPDPSNPSFDQDPLTDEILIERTGKGLSITGSDSTSTCFAIFRFAEEFLGWRYYQPGELGLELLDKIPEPPAIPGLAGILLLERASFHSRNPSSLGAVPNSPDWRIWHGLRERFQYNHTLHRALPPTEFDTHPEWFAKDETGKPMRPPYYPKVHGYNDHPDLSHLAVRDWVVEKTLQALDASTPLELPPGMKPNPAADFPRIQKSPGILSVSISLGDSFVFGSFPEGYPWSPDGTFRRWPDWSNHVFAYSNAVAEGITAGYRAGEWKGGQRPDLYIGALAYLNWENVPDFPLHPSIVPYLTFDRSQWYDREAKADDLRNVSAWDQTEAPFLGTWDYLFGYGFLIPRSMTAIVSESIPALHARGVRAYFCQIAAIWPYDGHTNWLLSRLLWNAGANPAALVDEYFREVYGPAAVPMRAFFDRAETIWMRQGGSGWWLRHWKDPWQAGLWKQSDLDGCEALLVEAALLARENVEAPAGLDAGRFEKRIGQTRDLFDLTKAFHTYQSLCWQLQTVDWNPADPSSLREGARLAALREEAKAALIRTRDRVVSRNPLARYASDLEWIFRYDGLKDASRGDLWNPDAARQRVQVLYDTDFSEVDNRKIWHRQFMDSAGMSQESTREPAGFLSRNVRRGHLYQLFPAEPGSSYLGQVDLETRQSLTGEVYIRLDFFNESHGLIAESRRARIAPVDLFGPRQTIRAFMQAPPNAAYGRLFIRFYEMDPGSQAFLRSAEVFQLSSPTP